MKNKILAITMGIVLLLVLSIAHAETNDDITLINGSYETAVISPQPQFVSVLGANTITANLNTNTQTNDWQGFWGEITNIITLNDNTGIPMIDWVLPLINGEIYASTSNTVSWNTMLDSPVIPLDPTRSDTESETFTQTYNGNWTVGNSVIENPPMVQLYDNNGNGVWNETLLNDGTGYVYGTQIMDDETCFNGVSCDFEMIVPEDNSGNTNPTTYYFYVELE